MSASWEEGTCIKHGQIQEDLFLLLDGCSLRLTAEGSEWLMSFEENGANWTEFHP